MCFPQITSMQKMHISRITVFVALFKTKNYVLIRFVYRTCAFSAQMQLSNAMCAFRTFEMNLFQIGTSWIFVIVLCSLNEIVTDLLSCNH